MSMVQIQGPAPKPFSIPIWASVAGMISGGLLVIVGAISWYNEFAAGPAKSFTSAIVVRVDDRPPYSSPKPRRMIFFDYPVFQYRDPKGFNRELQGKGCLPRHFAIGDSVQLGETGSRTVVMDSWFRAQEHVVLLGFGLGMFALGTFALNHLD
jgi:hypothetical protein